MMKRRYEASRAGRLAGTVLVILLLAGCEHSSRSCPPLPRADLSGVIAGAGDDRLEFRFPLDEPGDDVYPPPADFCKQGCGRSPDEYHAAEDYPLSPGTPVYAMADGVISFSGPAGGYGWLVIIDHPQANIYSLYGHLSPSRWRLESGPVKKGDLIAYLGDSDENGGSPEKPLRPHLHFAIRAGQRADYPGMGQWRWQAGWIKPCPTDVGWLHPSEVIVRQEIPPGGFPKPEAGLFEKWGIELAFLAVYLFGGVGAVVFAVRKKNPVLPAFYGSLMIAAGWLFHQKRAGVCPVFFSMAVLLIVFAILQYARPTRSRPAADEAGDLTPSG